MYAPNVSKAQLLLVIGDAFGTNAQVLGKHRDPVSHTWKGGVPLHRDEGTKKRQQAMVVKVGPVDAMRQEECVDMLAHRKSGRIRGYPGPMLKHAIKYPDPTVQVC